jgi:hypothetical protein
LKAAKKLVKFSSATMIVTFQPRVALRSLSKENGVSSEKARIEGAGLISWPPRSPNFTPCDFYLWEYEKDHVYYPPTLQSLRELRELISNGVANVDE